MAAKVYANGMEVSGKASTHKVIASMPDVCMSPPSPPAGPIPIPYPNFAQASDTTGGSKTVMAGGKEINLKGSSKYKKSKGDEAATRSFGAGVISHSISGAVKHKAGSMDVKVEGKSVVRTLDLTTGNHSNPGDGCMAPDAAGVAPALPADPECEALDNLNQKGRSEDVSDDRKNLPFTLTTALRTDANGNAKLMKAATPRDTIVSSKQNGYMPTNSKSTMACTDDKYNPQKQNDTEPKLIEPEFERGGKMVMKIHHQFNKAGKLETDGMPCGSCKKAVCAAQKCGLEIELCNDKNQKVKAADLCDNGQPKPVGGTGADKNAFWGSHGLA